MFLTPRHLVTHVSGAPQSRQLGLFVVVYLLLAVPPFFIVDEAALEMYRELFLHITPLVGIALGATVVAVLAGLALAREGIDRYAQFLFAPTDLLSVLVELSFALGAVAWWAVPALAVRTEQSLAANLLFVTVLLVQLPMVLFLSLMTVVGKA